MAEDSCLEAEWQRESSGLVRISLAGEHAVCEELWADPKPRGMGSMHVVFKAFTRWKEPVALHISKWNSANSADGFAMLLQMQTDIRFAPGKAALLRVLGICIDTEGSGFWPSHRQHHVGYNSVYVSVTEWVAPDQHMDWNSFLLDKSRRLRSAGHSSDSILAHLARPALELARGIAYLAEQGVLHGDLKQDNVRVNVESEVPVILDVNGLYRVAADRQGVVVPDAEGVSCCERKRCAALGEQGWHLGLHCPPECLRCAPFLLSSCEAWSLGVMCLHALTAALGLEAFPVWSDERGKPSQEELHAFLSHVRSHIADVEEEGGWRSELFAQVVECALEEDAYARCALAELIPRLEAMADSREMLDAHFRTGTRALGPAVSCSPGHPSTPSHDLAQYSTGGVRDFVAGVRAPLVVKALSCESHQVRVRLRLSGSGAMLWESVVPLHQGLGVASVLLASSTEAGCARAAMTVDIADLSGHILHRESGLAVVWESDVEDGGADLAQASEHATWGPEQTVLVGEDLVIPPEMTLVVLPGTVVVLSSGVNVEVMGRLVVRGTPHKACVLTSDGAEDPWGGVVVWGSARLVDTWLVNGGGDGRAAFGHSDSQAVLMVREGGRASMFGGGVVDSPGKAVGVLAAEAMLVAVVIARCDLGVEAVRGVVVLVDSDVAELPDGRGRMLDDDNDALRLSGVHASGRACVVERCRLSRGEDDGIDHDHALLHVKRTRIQGFVNEGIAVSGYGQDEGAGNGAVTIEDVVVAGCGQGIELGYGAALLEGRSILVSDNGVGVRYGCEHAWGHRGEMRLEQLIAVGNQQDYLNRFEAPPGSHPWHVRLECALMGGALQAAVVELSATWDQCGACGMRQGSTSTSEGWSGGGAGGVGGRETVFCSALRGLVAAQMQARLVVDFEACPADGGAPTLHCTLEGLFRGETYHLAATIGGRAIGSVQVEGTGRTVSRQMRTEATGETAELLLLQVDLVHAASSLQVQAERRWIRAGCLEGRGQGLGDEGELLPAVLRLPSALLRGFTLTSLRRVGAATLNLPPPDGHPPLPVPNEGWCGFSARGTAERVDGHARDILEENSAEHAQEGSGGFKVAVKTIGGDLEYHDSEDDRREVLAYCLDRALGRLGVVLPSGSVAVSDTHAAQLSEKGSKDQRVLAAQSQCHPVRVNTTHFRAVLSPWAEGLVKVPVEVWSLVWGRETSSHPFPLSSDGSWPSNLLPYVAFNFVGNCMRSDHNHHVLLPSGTPSQPPRWLALDNDRCFVPARVASSPRVPAAHRRRWTQWSELALSHCDWPATAARKLLHAAQRTVGQRGAGEEGGGAGGGRDGGSEGRGRGGGERGSGTTPLAAALHGCMAEMGASAADQRVPVEVLAEMQERLQALASHLVRCGFARTGSGSASAAG